MLATQAISLGNTYALKAHSSAVASVCHSLQFKKDDGMIPMLLVVALLNDPPSRSLHTSLFMRAGVTSSSL